MRSAPFSELYCSSVFRISCSAVSIYSLDERPDYYAICQPVGMHHEATSKLRDLGSDVISLPTITPRSEDGGRRMHNKGCLSNFKHTIVSGIIGMILPTTPKSKNTAFLEPSELLGSTTMTRKKRDIKPWEVRTQPKRVAKYGIYQYPEPSTAATALPACIAPMPKEESLRVLLLKHRALKSGLMKPIRPFVTKQSEPGESSDEDSSDDDSFDDDEMERRMNKFEERNDYD